MQPSNRQKSLPQTHGRKVLNTKLSFRKTGRSVRLNIELSLPGTGIRNSYPLWVYPVQDPVCPASVYETTVLDEKAEKILKEGGTVYLAPPSTKEAIPNSAQAQFTTDFWSVGTFQSQEGTMGLQDLQEYPEARALLNSIYRYLDSDEFAPEEFMTTAEIRGLFSTEGPECQ